MGQDPVVTTVNPFSPSRPMSTGDSDAIGANGDQRAHDSELLIFRELLDERRSRREPEHTLIAAYLAFAGAAIWGVATLATTLQHNAAIEWAGWGCAIVALLVVVKIVHTGRRYDVVMRELAEITPRVLERSSSLPAHLRRSQLNTGRWFSIAVVISAAAVAGLFCFKVLHTIKS